MTGLSSKRMLEPGIQHHLQILAQEIAREDKKDVKHFSLLIIDIDKFKRINKEQGYRLADKLIIEFAKHLEKSTRGGDIVGRWGGDEFYIIAINTSRKRARKFVAKIMRNLHAHEFTSVEGISHLDASIGAASTSEGLRTYEALFDTARERMQAVKNEKEQGNKE